ncbi:MAG: hypothetical protein M3320_07110 [Actinomycetota bacterium]|nr:hypothetical protein [Actinomycetota bacterium]MDQ5808431.1 hypothetical protein [Actinomycetota bacterium]
MLLLIHESREPSDDAAPPPRRSLPHVPWRPFAWVAAFCWLLFLAGAVGGLAGYVILLGAISLGLWRLNRWLDGLHWTGMRDYTRGY